MTIVVNAYIPTTNGLSWRNKVNGGAGQFGIPWQHAERIAYNGIIKHIKHDLDVIHFSQTGFPCSTCDNFFKSSEVTIPIVMLITQNNGEYSKCHGLKKNVALPVVIYYYKGDKKIVGMWSRAPGEGDKPNGFPDHPDIEER